MGVDLEQSIDVEEDGSFNYCLLYQGSNTMDLNPEEDAGITAIAFKKDYWAWSLG